MIIANVAFVFAQLFYNRGENIYEEFRKKTKKIEMSLVVIYDHLFLFLFAIIFHLIFYLGINFPLIWIYLFYLLFTVLFYIAIFLILFLSFASLLFLGDGSCCGL